MVKRKHLVILVIALAIAFFFFFGYRHWHSADAVANRGDLLSLIPADANAVAFVDLHDLRSSPFFAQLMSLAPQPSLDNDYKQFVQATGFDYEHDLDCVALALNRQPQTSSIFAVAEGRFDRKKIEAYAAQFGSLKTAEGGTLFAIPMSNGFNSKAYFAFLRDDRVVWTNDSSYFFQRPLSGSPQEWRDHFSRVAGTPIFVVMRQDSVPVSVLAQAPGGFRSPQLATLLSQLQWISISGKPEGNALRVVADGESLTPATTHQLKDVLSGLVVLAQVGLSDAKTRQQLNPELRQGYLDLLQSAEIDEIDRGTSKSVRVMFEVSPKLLQALQTSAPTPKPQTGNTKAK